jgi:hypothetical protein
LDLSGTASTASLGAMTAPEKKTQLAGSSYGGRVYTGPHREIETEITGLRRNMQLRRCAVLLPLFFGLAFKAYPQADTGVITGRVVDSSGAAMPNVHVAIVQTETNFHYTSVTNDDGMYRVQSLQTGHTRLPLRRRALSA